MKVMNKCKCGRWHVGSGLCPKCKSLVDLLIDAVLRGVKKRKTGGKTNEGKD